LLPFKIDGVFFFSCCRASADALARAGAGVIHGVMVHLVCVLTAGMEGMLGAGFRPALRIAAPGALPVTERQAVQYGEQVRLRQIAGQQRHHQAEVGGRLGLAGFPRLTADCGEQFV